MTPAARERVRAAALAVQTAKGDTALYAAMDALEGICTAEFVLALLAALEAAEGRGAKMEAALRPFANYAGSDEYLASGAPDHGWCAATSFTAGQYRNARAALSPATSGGQADG